MNSDEVKAITDSINNLSKRIRTLEAVELLVPGTTVVSRTTQTIGDSATTPISFDSGVVGNGFAWAIGDPTNVYFVSAREAQRALLVGVVQWHSAAPPVGGATMRTQVSLFRPGGTDTRILSSQLLASTGAIAQSWAFPVVFTSGDLYTRFNIEVYQSQGGNVDVDLCTVGVFFIR